jgi:DNA-binding NtrC family response regulator
LRPGRQAPTAKKTHCACDASVLSFPCPMRLFILSSPRAPVIESKVAPTQIPVQRFTCQTVQDLNHDTAELVYILPIEAIEDPAWPQLRVRLAQANRYYLIAGQGLQTAQIVNATRDGAFDVLSLDDSDRRWFDAIDKAVASQRVWLKLYGGTRLTAPESLLGNSAAMKSLRQAIERLGPTVASVLILGESGVGKERVAAALHAASGRGQFVALNCAAIPKELMEAELFGAERGAYTGATRTRPGLVEQASGGTLFLDEIGEMDIKLQPKLLRFLETRKTRRVGGNTEIQSEVRVLSATNSNLESEIALGKFRSDLYYRLSEVILHVPPLRTRPEDIPQFAMAFLHLAGERLGKFFDSIEPELIRKFQTYEWPGNVRELRNAIDRVAILYDGPTLRAAWWEPPQPSFQNPADLALSSASAQNHGAPLLPGLPLSRKQKLESARRLLESSGNDLTWVAAQLGIHPTTLYRWRKAGKL